MSFNVVCFPVRVLKRLMWLLLLWLCTLYVVLKFAGQQGSGRQFLDLGLQGSAEKESVINRLARELLNNAPQSTTTTARGSNAANDLNKHNYVYYRNLFTKKPLVDISIPKSELDMFSNLQEHIPSLPKTYWLKKRNLYSNGRTNASCATFPSIYDLQINNQYWQKYQSANGVNFYLYGAYYDNRTVVESQKESTPVVRILAMIDSIQPPKTLCQLWFESKQANFRQPLNSIESTYTYLWHKLWGNYKNGFLQPYLITCALPYSGDESSYFHNYSRVFVPDSVSLVENHCQNATNNLRVMYELPPDGKNRNKFAVCVKGMSFLQEDISVRLVEWLELLNMLGAHKVFMYDLAVHPNVSRVLKHYQKTGFVDLRPLSLPGGQINIKELFGFYFQRKIVHKRQNELIPYNDCLYRNLYRYEYVVLLDTDEIIMPVRFSHWVEMIDAAKAEAESVKKGEPSAFCMRNVYFFDDLINTYGWSNDIPQYMHILQHVYRAQNFTKPGLYVKCFHNLRRVLAVHNHYPRGCWGGGKCLPYGVAPEMAQLQHYRKDCVTSLKKSCQTEFKVKTVKDTTVWRYKDTLINNTVKVLNNLQFV